jgi:hypothetical protein
MRGNNHEVDYEEIEGLVVIIPLIPVLSRTSILDVSCTECEDIAE